MVHRFGIIMFCTLGLLVPRAVAQDADVSEAPRAKSMRTALGLSLVLPGLGHRYVHDGRWTTAASVFALTDLGLWATLGGTAWRRGQIVESYETLAASRAGAEIEGKDRAFFLNLATYRSSDAYLEAQLRNRAWDQLDYVETRSFQWAWETEADFQRFRTLRDDAESLRQRRPFLITVLVGNRLIAAFTAVRAAQRVNRTAPSTSFSLALPPPGAATPQLRVQARF